MKGTNKEYCITQRIPAEERCSWPGTRQTKLAVLLEYIRAGVMDKGTQSKGDGHGRMQSVLESMTHGGEKWGDG